MALAACTSSTQPTTALLPATTGPSASGGSGGGSAGPNASTVTWTSCTDVAQQELKQTPRGYTFDCGTIHVPQDWHDPNNGQTFDIALIRARSTQQTNRIGSLLVNPGGPGASGVDAAIDLTQELPSDITQRFDIVGFDPRGVGRSTEVQCLTAANEDKLFAAEPDPVTDAQFNAVVQLTKTASATCGTKYGAKLPLFSTEQAARDMDAIRAAVGDDKLTYLGYSYGTLLGATYAQLFPKNIRALVLDGAIDPTLTAVGRAESQATGFELAFSQFVAWCKTNAARCPIYRDPHGAVVNAIAAARQSPQTNSDGRKVTDGLVLYAVIESMYSQQLWPALGVGIQDLDNRDPAVVMELADAYAERDSSGHYSNLFDANLAVNCADFGTEPTVAQVRQLQSQWRAKYPLFGASMAIGLLSCAVGEWPGKYDPYPTGPAVGAPPILVVGTTNDPATPYVGTAKLASMLGVGEVLTWQGEGHTAYPQTPCIVSAVDNYLVNLKPPAQGTVCPKA